MGKVVSKICNIISSLFMVVVICVCIALIVPRFFGYQIYTVLSGSMEPTYHVGAVVYIDQKVKAEEIKEKDPIAFHLSNGEIATHRVVKVEADKQQFITKGDANNTKDIDPIPFSQLIGKAVFTIPYIGFISVNIKTTKGIIVATACVVVMILLYAIPLLVDGKSDEGESEGDK